MKKDIDFTKGSIIENLIKFSIPLLLGNLLQQLYFLGDTIIVGNYIGSIGLGAMSSATAITVLFIFFFQGIASGAGVIVSHMVGSREIYKIKKAIICSTVFTLIFGGITSVLGYNLSEWVLKWINVPIEVFGGADEYLKIAMLGMLPMLMFNMGSVILQSMGDAKSPIYYLGVASFINVGLDYIFVKIMSKGIGATAIATIIAQVIATIFVMFKIYFKNKDIESIDSRRCDKLLDLNLMWKIIKVGIPIGIQSVVINFSNVIVQNHINLIGENAMASWSLFCRVENFVILPMLSFRLAIMTFSGQNYGAKHFDRIRKGISIGNYMAGIITFLASLVTIVFAREIFTFFTRDEEVIVGAIDMIYNMLPFYFLIAIASALQGGIMGMGNSFVPMMINTLFMCVLRVILIPILAEKIGIEMSVLYYVYWISWIFTFVASVGYYIWYGKKKFDVSITNL